MGGKANRKTGRKTTATGRSVESKHHIRFYGWMMKSEAFKQLKASEVRVLLELYSLYNGRNNGYLFLSCREAARRCRISKDTASKSFQKLTSLGFISRRAHYPENYYLREANHWVLSEFEFNGRPATKDFMRWESE